MAQVIELRQLDDEELENRLAEYRRELMNLRFQLATGQLDNVSRIPQVRRDVARVLTLLRERDIDEVEADLATAERAPGLLEDARRRSDEAAAAREAAAQAEAAGSGDTDGDTDTDTDTGDTFDGVEAAADGIEDEAADGADEEDDQ